MFNGITNLTFWIVRRTEKGIPIPGFQYSLLGLTVMEYLLSNSSPMVNKEKSFACKQHSHRIRGLDSDLLGSQLFILSTIVDNTVVFCTYLSQGIDIHSTRTEV